LPLAPKNLNDPIMKLKEVCRLQVVVDSLKCLGVLSGGCLSVFFHAYAVNTEESLYSNAQAIHSSWL